MLEADGTTVRAARRLDDSLVDLGDQHRYEGSLFKLTAKPPVQNTEKPLVTAMTDLNKVMISWYRKTAWLAFAFFVMSHHKNIKKRYKVRVVTD